MATPEQIIALVQFIESTQLKLIKHNERPHGSYELAMSWDGIGWFTDGQVFGSAFSTHEAACIIFAKYILTPPLNAQFAVFMGQEHLTKLFSIIKYN